MRILRVVAWIAAAAAIGGCASRPVNERITQVDPKSGYRPYLLIPLTDLLKLIAGTIP